MFKGSFIDVNTICMGIYKQSKCTVLTPSNINTKMTYSTRQIQLHNLHVKVFKYLNPFSYSIRETKIHDC